MTVVNSTSKLSKVMKLLMIPALQVIQYNYLILENNQNGVKSCCKFYTQMKVNGQFNILSILFTHVLYHPTRGAT